MSLENSTPRETAELTPDGERQENLSKREKLNNFTERVRRISIKDKTFYDQDFLLEVEDLLGELVDFTDSEGDTDERAEAEELLTELGPVWNKVKEFIHVDPEEELDEETKEQLIQQLEDGLSEFGLDLETLEKNNERFRNLSYERKVLVLDNLKQLALGKVERWGKEEQAGKLKQVKRKGSKTFKESLKGTFKNFKEDFSDAINSFGTQWSNFKTNFLKGAKIEALAKAKLEDIKVGKYSKEVEKALEEVLDIEERNADGIVVNEEDRVSVERAFVKIEDGVDDESIRIVEEFNQSAIEFANIPEAWRSKTYARAEKAKFQKYENTEKRFLKAKSELLSYLKAQTIKEILEKNSEEGIEMEKADVESMAYAIAMERASEIDSQIYSSQKLSSNPDVEKRLLQIKDTSKLSYYARALFKSEKGWAFGLGAASRQASRAVSLGSVKLFGTAVSGTSLSLFGVAVGVGAWRGKIRGNEFLIEEEGRVRGRNTEQSILGIKTKIKELEDKKNKLSDENEISRIDYQILLYNDQIKALEKETEDKISKKEYIQSLRSEIEALEQEKAKTKDKEELDKLELALCEKKSELNAIDITDEEEAYRRQYLELAKKRDELKKSGDESALKKLNSQLESVQKKYKKEQNKKIGTERAMEDAPVLVGKIDIILKRLEDAETELDKAETEEDKIEIEKKLVKLNRSLRTRLNFTRKKIADGLINFGDDNETMSNNLMLVKSLEKAEGIIGFYTKDEKGFHKIEKLTESEEARLAELKEKAKKGTLEVNIDLTKGVYIDEAMELKILEDRKENDRDISSRMKMLFDESEEKVSAKQGRHVLKHMAYGAGIGAVGFGIGRWVADKVHNLTEAYQMNMQTDLNYARIAQLKDETLNHYVATLKNKEIAIKRLQEMLTQAGADKESLAKELQNARAEHAEDLRKIYQTLREKGISVTGDETTGQSSVAPESASAGEQFEGIAKTEGYADRVQKFVPDLEPDDSGHIPTAEDIFNLKDQTDLGAGQFRADQGFSVAGKPDQGVTLGDLDDIPKPPATPEQIQAPLGRDAFGKFGVIGSEYEVGGKIHTVNSFERSIKYLLNDLLKDKAKDPEALAKFIEANPILKDLQKEGGIDARLGEAVTKLAREWGIEGDVGLTDATRGNVGFKLGLNEDGSLRLDRYLSHDSGKTFELDRSFSKLTPFDWSEVEEGEEALEYKIPEAPKAPKNEMSGIKAGFSNEPKPAAPINSDNVLSESESAYLHSIIEDNPFISHHDIARNAQSVFEARQDHAKLQALLEEIAFNNIKEAHPELSDLDISILRIGEQDILGMKEGSIRSLMNLNINFKNLNESFEHLNTPEAIKELFDKFPLGHSDPKLIEKVGFYMTNHSVMSNWTERDITKFFFYAHGREDDLIGYFDEIRKFGDNYIEQDFSDFILYPKSETLERLLRSFGITDGDDKLTGIFGEKLKSLEYGGIDKEGNIILNLKFKWGYWTTQKLVIGEKIVSYDGKEFLLSRFMDAVKAPIAALKGYEHILDEAEIDSH